MIFKALKFPHTSSCWQLDIGFLLFLFLILLMSVFKWFYSLGFHLLNHTSSSDQTSPASGRTPPPAQRDSEESQAQVGPGGAAGPGTGSPDFQSRSPPWVLRGRGTALQGEATTCYTRQIMGNSLLKRVWSSWMFMTVVIKCHSVNYDTWH